MDGLLGRLLPLGLLAAMVVIALVLEATVHDTLLWQTKLPLAGLILWAFVAAGRSAKPDADSLSGRGD